MASKKPNAVTQDPPVVDGTISEIPPESAKSAEAGDPASLSQGDVTDTLADVLVVTGFPSIETLTHMAKIGRDIVVLIDGYREEGASTIFYPAMAEAPADVVEDLFKTVLSLRESIVTAGAAVAVAISPSSTGHDREKLLEAFDALGVDVRAMVAPDNFATWSVEPADIDSDTGPSFAEQLAELTAGESLSGFAEHFPLTAAALAAFETANERGVMPTAIRIKSEREAFRRAGIVHSRAQRDYPPRALSPDQVEVLLADPVLTVEFILGDD